MRSAGREKAPMPRTARTIRRKPARRATLTEGADYSGRHRATLRRWIAEGRISGWKQGKLILVDLDELDELTKPIGG
jgi:excisionase family DNA binding protein